METEERQQIRLVLAALFLAARITNGASAQPEVALSLADELLALVKV